MYELKYCDIGPDKKSHSKEQIEIVWRCDADRRNEDTQENATHKNGGKKKYRESDGYTKLERI
jgi:hypothetical protein